jgi:hypothetical protein
MKITLELADIADAVAFVVWRELFAESEEVAGGADAIVTWSLEKADDEPDLARLAALVYCLSWSVTLHFESLFGRRAA